MEISIIWCMLNSKMVDGNTSHSDSQGGGTVLKDQITIKESNSPTKMRKKKKRNRRKQKTSDILSDVTVTRCNKIIVNVQPVITKDSRHIICSCGNIIAIFRRKTGLLEKSFTEHKYDVTNVYINQQDPSQVISCSSREFIVWDYDDMSIAKKYVFTFAATAWYINPKSYEDVYYKGTLRNDGTKDSNKEQLIKWNVTGSCEPTALGKISKSMKSVAISRNGEYTVYVYKNELSIYMHTAGKKNSFTFDNVHLTSVALHPTEVIVGTGDKVGKIILWYNLIGDEEQVCSQLHWHNSMVTDMLFTNDGHYIMSGGNEGVLVVWQLETQKKSFIPRVGGAIQHLVQSSDDQYICLSLDNNMIKILSTVTSKLMKAIKYLAQAYELPAGLSYHSPTECLVLNGRPDGVLQFYQAREDYVKLSIDIIGENLISSVEGRYVYPTRVKHIAFSDDGNWMATVEEREDRILPTERKLKFWKYEEDTKNYSLNTLVDPPHGDEIHSLCFRPCAESSEYGYITVTTSEDGDIKMWEFNEDTDNKGNIIETWQIHSISNYGMKRCYQACFSEDGTILAVLFSSVTLWDPENLTFKRCLQFNAKDDDIKAIAFAHNESSHILIGHSANYLIVWNIVNIMECSIAWMLELSVHLITCDPYSKYFAAFVGPGEKTLMDLYLFEPASSSPVTVRYEVNKRHARISSALFTPNKSNGGGKSVWSETGQLYILTENTEILTVQEYSAEVEEEVNGNVIEKESDATSAFEDIFGATLAEGGRYEDDNDDESDGGTGEKRRIPLGNPSSAVIRKMISTPANALPSTDVLCKVYMKSLLIPKCDVRDEEEENAMEAEESHSTERNEKQENLKLASNDNDHDNTTTYLATNSSGDDVVIPEKNYTPSDELLEKVSKWNFDFIIYPYVSD